MKVFSSLIHSIKFMEQQQLVESMAEKKPTSSGQAIVSELGEEGGTH